MPGVWPRARSLINVHELAINVSRLFLTRVALVKWNIDVVRDRECFELGDSCGE